MKHQKPQQLNKTALYTVLFFILPLTACSHSKSAQEAKPMAHKLPPVIQESVQLPAITYLGQSYDFSFEFKNVSPLLVSDKGLKYEFPEAVHATIKRNSCEVSITSILRPGLSCSIDGTIVPSSVGEHVLNATFTFAPGQSISVSRRTETKKLVPKETVYCHDKAVGAHFEYLGETYLVSSNQTIKGDIKYWLKHPQEVDGICTSKVTDMSGLFKGDYGSENTFNNDISNWDTSNVTSMYQMFYYATKFNQDISDWDTSKVEVMTEMFYSAYLFNQPIGAWNTSNVHYMGGVFSETKVFNQDIGSWDTSNVRGMGVMFDNAQSFNQDISHWDTSNLANMSGMFSHAKSFNQDIGSWDTSNVIRMDSLFSSAESFNQDISRWNTRKVEDMRLMFAHAGLFNQDISHWDTSKVTDMGFMFNGARAFNQPIGSWDTSKVKDMSAMFSGARAFNQSIGHWDTSNVENMKGLFEGAVTFNQDISKWDTSKAENMDDMFKGAVSFNQNISQWDVALAKDALYYRAFASKSPIEDNKEFNPFLAQFNSKL